MRKYLLLLGMTLLLTGCLNQSDRAEVALFLLDETGTTEAIGTVMLSDSDQGLLIESNLKNLSPGTHGFHIHENPSCEALTVDGVVVPGKAAGGHFDPHNTGRHEGPNGDGHLGDLPPLVANEAGESIMTLVAPRLSLDAIQGRSLMVHMKGDNFSDTPAALGGGGSRVACGLINF